MSDTNPERITDATTPEGVDGTTDGNPIAGAEISEEEHDRAVTPDDDVQEVDGPQQSHP
jgi:hypothetical protein